MHNHTPTCTRTRRTRDGQFRIVCRFHFPRPTSNVTVLAAYDIEQMHKNQLRGGKRQLNYTLARSEAEILINPYNVKIILLWKSNIDIQYIGEPAGGFINMYITCYATKEEKEATEEIWDSIEKSIQMMQKDPEKEKRTGMKSLSMKLAYLINHILNTRECGAPETCIRLLSLPMCRSSDSIVYVNTNLPEERRRKLKPILQLEEEQENDSPYENNLVDVYYPLRSDKLAETNLYDIATKYR